MAIEIRQHFTGKVATEGRVALTFHWRTDLVNNHLTDLLPSSFLPFPFTVAFDRKFFSRLLPPGFWLVESNRSKPAVLLVMLQLGRVASHRPIALSQSLHTSLVLELSFWEGVWARDGRL